MKYQIEHNGTEVKLWVQSETYGKTIQECMDDIAALGLKYDEKELQDLLKTAVDEVVVDEPVRRIVDRVISNIHDLNEAFYAFWGQSDETINEILAHKGAIEITNIFTSHYESGVAFNKILEDRGISSPRAVLTKPRELTVNEQGYLVVVPIPPPLN